MGSTKGNLELKCVRTLSSVISFLVVLNVAVFLSNRLKIFADVERFSRNLE